MVLGKLPVPGRPTIWMIVGQGPTVLAVGAVELFGQFYSSLSFLFSFSMSEILSFLFSFSQTKKLSQRALKPQTTATTLIAQR